MSKSNHFCHIIRIEYNNEVKFVKLKKTIYSVGRSSQNAIVIHHHKVSREHCLIVPVTDHFGENEIRYDIVDGSLDGKPSSNGLFLDLEKWTLRHRLRTGDIIGIGSEEVILMYFTISTNELDKSKENNKSLESPEIMIGKEFIN